MLVREAKLAAQAVKKGIKKARASAKKKAQPKKPVTYKSKKTGGASKLLGSGGAAKAGKAKVSRAQRNQSALKKARNARNAK